MPFDIFILKVTWEFRKHFESDTSHHLLGLNIIINNNKNRIDRVTIIIGKKKK